MAQEKNNNFEYCIDIQWLFTDFENNLETFMACKHIFLLLYILEINSTHTRTYTYTHIHTHTHIYIYIIEKKEILIECFRKNTYPC